jgi:aryl-alcohol dehydrogenase-like predicted oxidoreductase
MKKQKLGNNGPDISVVGFGAWEAGGQFWGPGPTHDKVIQAMRDGFDAGMTWIDTAEVYGRGQSEEIVGEAVRDYPDVLVFTKVAPKPSGSGFKSDQVRQAAEQSLKRLGKDHIDLYQLHWPDGNVPVEETWQAMAQLVDDGLVRWIGVSNFDVPLMERCEKIRHVDSLQPHFSMLHRGPLDDRLPYCDRNGTGVIAYGPLGFGLLTGAFTKETTFPDDDWRSGKMGMDGYQEMYAPGTFEKNIGLVERLKVLAKDRNIAVGQLALAWVFHQKGVTAAIAGSRSSTHTVENAGGGDVSLGAADLAEVEALLTE